MEGQRFRKTKEALVAKQKELEKERKGNKPNAARMLTDEEVDILYGQDLLGCSSSEALINTIWLNSIQFFGLRGCQDHRDMIWGDVEQDGDWPRAFAPDNFFPCSTSLAV